MAREWLERATRLYIQGFNYSEISEEVKVKNNTIAKAFSKLSKEYRQRMEVEYLKNKDKPTKESTYDKKYKNPILVIPDLHIPFHHPHFLQFLKDIDKKFKCDEQKISVGDLVDNHAISRHKKSSNADGPKEEYDKAKSEVKKFVEAFPNVKLTKGNHDDIPIRQATEVGLYHGFLKSFAEAWDLPDTWEIDTLFEYKDVIYKHGINCGGVNGARATAIKEAKSTVIGHIHSHGGIHYAANKSKMIFGANAGCGIDTKTYAFEYGKEFKDKPTLGCVVVFSPEWAVFIPMAIDYYNEKYGR